MEYHKEELIERLKVNDLIDIKLFPKFFEVETIRACNADCEMCTVREWENKNNRMDQEIFNRIAEEMKGYSDWINRVTLSRNGEPLLDKGLVDKIKLLKRNRIKYVTFSTNVSLLNENKANELIDSGLDDIRFSIDGYTKETFESIRRKLNFEEVVYNAKNFIKIRNSKGRKLPIVEIRMTEQEKNRHEVSLWTDYWRNIVSSDDVVYSKPMHSWGNQLSNYQGENNEIEKYSLIPCVSPFSTMIIHFDGKIPLCGCDYNNKNLLGDIRNSTIKDVWNNENYEKVRELHLTGKRNLIELCQGCNLWDLEIKKVY